jgi:mercuric ion binding protein
MYRLTVAMLILVWPGVSLAENDCYVMRVDGLACPYCAYGVEKKLFQIDGVTAIEIDLDNGVITVNVREDVHLRESDMQKLFNDAGFTFRGLSRKSKPCRAIPLPRLRG